MKLYLLCDLLGWLLDQGRVNEHDEVIRRSGLGKMLDGRARLAIAGTS